MKIAYWCNEYPPRNHGGIGSFVYAIAHGLIKEGHEVTVLELGDRYGERMDDGIKIVTIGSARMPHFKGVLNRRRIRNFLRRMAIARQIDVIEIPEFQGILPYRFKYCPVIVRLQLSYALMTKDDKSGQNKRVVKREYNSLRQHKRWIGVSQYILDQTKKYFGISPVHETVVYNPVTLESSRIVNCRTDRKDKIVLFVGTVSERKGALTLAKSARLVLKREEDVLFVYVGSIQEIQGKSGKTAIENEFGMENLRNLRMIGYVKHEEIAGWMKGASVLVLPSRLEACPIVPLEAMEMGVPVIYTNRAPGPEIIENGRSGILVDPDSPEEIAAKIIEVLTDGKLAQRLISGAKAAVLGDSAWGLASRKHLHSTVNSRIRSVDLIEPPRGYTRRPSVCVAAVASLR